MTTPIICECGHQNPVGTELCERCGKPFDDKDEGILYMRYEGAALRSKKKNKIPVVDHIWNFLASVKVGVSLLVITLIASMIGTIYPQELYIPATADPYQYYPEQHGTLGYIYVTLGFHNLYSSWWYIILLILIGASITVASIDRGIPLYRSLSRQQVKRHAKFMKRQRINAQVKVDHPDQMMDKLSASLKAMRYKVSYEDGAILGEKNRFSRWGAYVVHLGLVIILLGALIRIIPGFTMDQYVWVRDGETVPVPQTDNRYYIESEGFDVRFYEQTDDERLIPEEFRTEAILYENRAEQSGKRDLVEVKRQTIRVNEPLRHDGLTFYQSDYKMNEFSQFTFALTHKESGHRFGEVEIDLFDPEALYELNDGYQVELVEYYPDFELDQTKTPQTKTPIPNNPAFIFRVITPDNPEGETSMVLIRQTIEPPGAENEYALKIQNITFNNVSGLMVRTEKTLPIIYTGLAIAMAGLVLCFYWQHKRIWIQVRDGEIWLAAYTQKNWYAFKKDVDRLIDETGLPLDKETLDKEESKDE